MLFGRFIHHEPDVQACRQAEQLELDAAFAQSTKLLVRYFGEAALGDAKLEQPDTSKRTEHQPPQQKLYEKGYLRLQRSACGRPNSNLQPC